MTVSDSPLATVEVMDAATQEVAVEARGPDVLNISGNVATPKDPDEVMPDWVDLIVAAVNLGMMSGAVLPPWSSRASVAKRIFEPVTARMQWNVALEQVDRGVFLVIMDDTSRSPAVRSLAADPDRSARCPATRRAQPDVPGTLS